MLKKVVSVVLMYFPFIAFTQENWVLDSNSIIYYAGINPVALFTTIRSNATSLYLPYFAGEEAGLSIFIGKLWNEHYNVETRLSYGSPIPTWYQAQVQSGFNYRFKKRNKNWNPYTGFFIELYDLHNKEIKNDQMSAISYWSLGNRVYCKRFLLDIRLKENICALSWINKKGAKAFWGFHPSLYASPSHYMPSLSFNIGYLFR